MASAKKLTKLVTKLVETKVTTLAGVDLKLDHEEAKALALLLTKIGGHPEETPRGLTDKIYIALSEAGYHGMDIAGVQANRIFGKAGTVVWAMGTIKDHV